jgi:anti-anti-sigma regulatory factor
MELDISGVTFLGLAGINAFSGCRRRLRARGAEFELTAVPAFAARVLRIAGWER